MVIQCNAKKTLDVRETCTKSRTQEQEAQEVADFETALDIAGYGRCSALALAGSSLALLASGMQNGVTAYSLPAAQCELHLTTYQMGLINMAFMLGGVMSAFLWGFVADVAGRKRVLIITLLLDSAITFGQSFTQSFGVLVVARGANGFLIGAPGTIAFTYIGDVVGAKRRNLFLSLTGLSFTVAWVILPALGWCLSLARVAWPLWAWPLSPWRCAVFVSGAPGAAAALCLAALPESPRLLANAGRPRDALHGLAWIYHKNTGRDVTQYPVKSLSGCSVSASGADAYSVWHEICAVGQQTLSLVRSPHLMRSALVAIVFVGNMSGGFVLGVWIPEFLARLRSHERDYPGSSVRICDVMEQLGPGSSSSNQSLARGLLSGNSSEEVCDDRLDTEVYYNSLLIGLSCVLAAACLSVLAAVRPRGDSRVATGACAAGVAAGASALYAAASPRLVLLAACVAQAAAVAGNVAVVPLAIAVYPDKISSLAVCAAVFAGRLGGVAGHAGAGALLDAACFIPFLYIVVVSAVSGLAVIFLKPEQRQTQLMSLAFKGIKAWSTDGNLNGKDNMGLDVEPMHSVTHI